MEATTDAGPPEPLSGSPVRIALEGIEKCFTRRSGFSCPEWPTIIQELRRFSAPAHRRAAWSELFIECARRWESELGDRYWTSSAGLAVLVSELEGVAAERVLERAQWLADRIRDYLGPLAWEGRPVILVVHVVDEALAWRFDGAVSGAGETDTIRCVGRIAPYTLICSRDADVILHDLESDLIWNCLSHLPLPRWVQSGLSRQLHRSVQLARGGQVTPVFDADGVLDHHAFWDVRNIQSFWAGTCDFEYPERANLAHELGAILFQLALEKVKGPEDYLRCAHYYDAGQSAALVCLKCDLGELAGTFLGPGCWAPDPLNIAECWERVRGMTAAGDSEEPG